MAGGLADVFGQKLGIAFQKFIVFGVGDDGTVIQVEGGFLTQGTFNLMEPIPFKKAPFDLIFCRNVMIYFEMETKLALVKRFYDVLRPGGYLFIGHAESIPRDSTDYEYIKPAIYRRPLK